MKRKLLVIALIFVMLFTSSMTALAESEVETPFEKVAQAYGLQLDEDTVTLLDEVVYIYEACAELETAVAELDHVAIHEAVYACRDYYNLMEQLEGKQYTWLGYLLGLGSDSEAEAVLDELYALIYPAEVFLELSSLYAPNVQLINDMERLESIISLYEDILENGEIGEAARTLFETIEGVDLDSFVEDVEARIDELNGVESVSENAQYVYNNLNGLYGTLKYAGDAVIQQTVEAFPQVLDVLEGLTDEELADLASLLGVADGEEAKAIVYSEWESVCAYLELGGAVAAFSADNTVENAQALVDCYEKATASEHVAALVAENYASIEEVKKAADDVLAEAAKNDENKEEEPAEEQKEEVKEESQEDQNKEESEEEQKPSNDIPATGDEIVTYLSLMILSAGAFMFFKKRGVINK